MKKAFTPLALTLFWAVGALTGHAANQLDPVKQFDNDSLMRACYNKPCIAPEGYGVLVDELSDEFNGTELDLTKWRSGGNGGWTGRGARFMADNISVKDGCLQLKSSIIGSNDDLKNLYMDVEEAFVPDKSQHKGEKIDITTWSPADYGDYWVQNWKSPLYDAIQRKGLDVLGAASVISLAKGTKGYYEARIRVSNITLSSAFWMQGNITEYDITESVGSRNVTAERLGDLPKLKNRVSTHVWINKKGFQGKGGVTPHELYVDQPLHEQYIVLGLKWEDELLTVYLNDKEIYNFPLTNLKTDIGDIPIPVDMFTAPQHVIFDTEVLLAPETGWPTMAELLDPTRNTFYIDWVRVWKEK